MCLGAIVVRACPPMFGVQIVSVRPLAESEALGRTHSHAGLLRRSDIFFCRLCGSHGAWRFVNLHRSFPGNPSSPKAKYVLKVLLQLKHPRTNEPINLFRKEELNIVREQVQQPAVPERSQLSAGTATERMAALKAIIQDKEARIAKTATRA